MTLGEKQRIFTRLIGLLIGYIYDQGYEASFGEAYRTPEQAAWYAQQGKGIKNSLHTRRLALDLTLFKNGKMLTKSEEYEPIGKCWEKLGKGEIQTCWGGRFGDGNHFSIADGGQK